VAPIPPGRCGHVAPMVVECSERGYAARCLRCGSIGPVEEIPGEARRALMGMGQRDRGDPQTR
jgi:hypothetical protein